MVQDPFLVRPVRCKLIKVVNVTLAYNILHRKSDVRKKECYSLHTS